MNINLRTTAEMLLRFLAAMWFVRAVMSLPMWVYFHVWATDDPLIAYTKNGLAVRGVASLVAAVLLYAGAPAMTRWLLRSAESAASVPTDLVLLFAVRFVGLCTSVVGVVFGISAFVGWYLESTSGQIDRVWFSEAEVRAGIIRGGVAALIGFFLMVWSRRVSSWITRDRANGA